MELEFPYDKTVKIVNWKVKEGNSIQLGNIIFDYVECGPDGSEINPTTRFKFKATKPGVIRKILAERGSSVSKGSSLLSLDPSEQCTHPIVLHDMCGVCSQDLRKLEEPQPNSASVAMVHSVPGLKVSMEEAQMLGKLDEQHLIKERKLVLLVDLDQTLIHTTNDNVPQNLENVFHFQLRTHGTVWYHTRLRPGTVEFLARISKLFQLHICTFGTRQYANTIAHYLDPNGTYFSDRILSRDECFSQNSKTANLKELFPRGDHMVCIIDDREDVWSFASNLIHVKPYHFFRHTGDINAPPGLTKKDNDDKDGFEFTGDEVKENDKSELSGQNNSQKAEIEKSNNMVQTPSEQNTTEVKGMPDLESDVQDPACREVEASSGVGGLESEGGEGKETRNSAKNLVAEENPPASETATDSIVVEKTSETETPETLLEVVKTSNEENNTSLTDSLSSAQNDEAAIISQENSTVIKVEDPDDYLLYLEEILISIHKAYYDLYDDMVQKGKQGVPDVKTVIPYVRRKVLKGTSIVFSGVIPTQVPLEKSRQYSLATGLGAYVSAQIIPPPKSGSSSKPSELPTTHLVAAREGTAKVNDARKRYRSIKIVTVEWLWSCAERWEHCEEKMFYLFKEHKYKKQSHSQRSSSSPSSPDEGDKLLEKETSGGSAESASNVAGPSKSRGNALARKVRTPSGRFMDTINPLLTFSMDEIAKMDHEVDDIFNESDSSSTTTDENDKIQPDDTTRVKRTSETLEDSSSNDTENESHSESSLLGKRKRSGHNETENDDEPLSAKFRRGEPLPSDLDTLNLLSGSSEDDDDQDDWMAEALEREFLDDNSQDQDTL